MIALPHALRVVLAVEPVDMRKSFDGLWAIAELHLEERPRDGSLYLFSNKARNRLKALYWDGSGVWVFAKRLEKGRFSWPLGSDRRKLSLKPESVTLLLNGIDLQKGCQKAWYEREKD